MFGLGKQMFTSEMGLAYSEVSGVLSRFMLFFFFGYSLLRRNFIVEPDQDPLCRALSLQEISL